MMLMEHVTIARRFQRSIRVDSDLGHADALHGFVCQRSAADGLVGMAGQIAQSTQRAFTWTGPYGGGKSSLAVAFAGFLGPKGRGQPSFGACGGPTSSASGRRRAGAGRGTDWSSAGRDRVYVRCDRSEQHRIAGRCPVSTSAGQSRGDVLV